VDGRNNDYLVLPNGDRISGATFYAALEYFPFVRQFRIIQERVGHCDILLRHNGSNPDNHRLVEEKIESILGGLIDYEVKSVDTIPNRLDR
jgi:hypothetical protein